MLLRGLKFFSPKNHLVWIKKSSHLSHGEGNLNCLFIHLSCAVLALWPLCYHLSCTWKKSENERSLIMACKRMLIVFTAMLKRFIEWLGLSWLEVSELDFSLFMTWIRCRIESFSFVTNAQRNVYKLSSLSRAKVGLTFVCLITFNAIGYFFNFMFAFDSSQKTWKGLQLYWKIFKINLENWHKNFCSFQIKNVD